MNKAEYARRHKLRKLSLLQTVEQFLAFGVPMMNTLQCAYCGQGWRELSESGHLELCLWKKLKERAELAREDG